MTTKIKSIDFEDYLSDQCDTHTNNDPAGFDKWLEELDGEQYMEYAQIYAEKCYLQGRETVLKEFEPAIKILKRLIDYKDDGSEDNQLELAKEL